MGIGIGYLDGGIGIGNQDWGLVLGVWIYEWGFGFMIGVLDPAFGLRIRIGDLYWEFGNQFEDWDWGFGFGNGNWDGEQRIEIGDWYCRLVFEIEIRDQNMRLEWELRLKMVYRLNITFDLEVHLDGFRDTGLVKEYNQL